MLKIKPATETIFESPLNKSNGCWNYKKITIPLEFKQYQSEISYIPGFNRSSLDKIIDQLKNIHIDKETLKQRGLLPEVKFVLSHLLLQQENLITPFKSLKVSHLYQAKELDSEISASVIKVKIGRSQPDEELGHIISCLKNNSHLKIRLDANQNLNLEKLQYFWNQLKDFHHQIDYFEEPFKGYSDYKNLKIPHAFDENLSHALTEKNKILVIKPSLFGDCYELIKLKETNHRVVLSHCYETNYLKPFLSYLASFWPDEYHGLN
jgi:O-succinylbenzoate synthase